MRTLHPGEERTLFDVDDFDPDLDIVAITSDGSVVGGSVYRPNHRARLVRERHEFANAG